MAGMVSFYFLPMRFETLLLQSKQFYENKPNQVEKALSTGIFTEGGKWMWEKMQTMDSRTVDGFDTSIPFTRYGFLKYGWCLSAFILSFFGALHIHTLLTPLSVLVFYFFEIHLLFLFPLLIDKTPYPIWKSIKITYKIGILKTLWRVVRIAFFMLIGIFNFKNPFKNWHIGCLFVLIWYQNEVRNRL
jgi:hypothetical protein